MPLLGGLKHKKRPLHLQWALFVLNLRASQQSTGVDGVTVPAFAAHLNDNLRGLRNAMRAGRYQPLPLRGVKIPKADGGWRLAGSPSIRDRVAQRAFLNVVVPLVDARFKDSSHAYRPARSIHTAIAQVEHARDAGRRFVLGADVEACFDSMCREAIAQTLARHFDDERALDLAKLWMEAGIDWGAGRVLGKTGIAQGDLVSPFLCNVFLDRFDAALLQQDLISVRYADDFLVPTRHHQRAQCAEQIVQTALSELGLSSAARKTRVTSFGDGFEFLGTLFVGTLAMPTHRCPSIKRGRVKKAIYTAGYERPATPARRFAPLSGVYLV